MMSQLPDDARADLTAQLDDLLNTVSNKFAGVSSEIFAKSELQQEDMHRGRCSFGALEP